MKPTILITDDEPANREMMDETLTGEGYPVIQARHGGEALQILRTAHPPIILLLDREMPFLSGDEVLEELEHHPSPPLAVVLVSGNDRRVPKNVRFLCKPVHPQVLLDTLARIEAGYPWPELAVSA